MEKEVKTLQIRKALGVVMLIWLINVLGVAKAQTDNIVFADSNVKAICVANWDTSGDGELNYAEAAAVTSLGLVFCGNTTITSFEELQYFIGLTSINDNAFQSCSNLTSVVFPNSLTSIGCYAFEYCIGLTGSLTIPNSVTWIYHYAFEGCTGLTGSLTIPDSVVGIGISAFDGCCGLTGSLTIGNSVNYIGSRAFYSCSRLTSVTIPSTVTYIEDYAFDECNRLTRLIVFAETPPLLVQDVFRGVATDIPVYVPTESLEAYAMANWGDFNNFLPISSGNITVSAEGGMVTGAGNYGALEMCTLTATASEGYTFAYWTANGIVVSTDAVYSFMVCGDLTLEAHFVIPGDAIVFADLNVKAICVAHWDYNGDGELGEGEAAAVNDLGMYFSSNQQITSFDELQYFTGLSSIGHYEFAFCTGLTTVVIPNSVTSIEYYAFGHCIGLTTISIPNDVTSIEHSVFTCCTGLTSVTIPNSVTYIGGSVFSECTGLTSMTVLMDNPPAISSSVFNHVNKSIPVYVPCGSLYAYQSASGWNEFNNYMPVIACESGEITVTVDPVESGIVTGAGFYESGATCTLIAMADEGYSFMHWTENGEVVSMETEYSFTVSGDRNLVANFIEGTVCQLVFDLYDYWGDSWTGNYLVVNYGDVSQQLTVSIGEYSSYTLLVPDGSHVELSWISGSNPEDCSFTVKYSNGNIIYQGQNLNDGFSFDFNMDCVGMLPPAYSVTVSANPMDGGMVSGGGTYEWGSTCTITATVNEGFNFVNWTENGKVVSTDTTYSFTVLGDRGLVANFASHAPIVFADANVKAVCVSQWDTNGDGELSYAEATAVTNIGSLFRDMGSITSFDELQYFTGLTSIPNYAFRNCYNLTSIVIPDFVTFIGSNAFANCNSLISIVIPNSMTNIKNNAFNNCNSLASIVIPNSVTSIEHQAFAFCSSLTSIEVPNSVTSIGDYAFRNCSSLTSVIISNSVTSIGEKVFYFCSSIEQIIVDVGNPVFDSRNNCNAIINTSTNELVLGCKSTIIPNSVTSIGYFAFGECRGLTSIEIPNSVTSIGHTAFYNCRGLTSIEIPNSVTTIGYEAFGSCSGLTRVSIPNSVTFIDSFAFSGCIYLSSITVLAENPPELGNLSFDPFDRVDKSIPVYVPCASIDLYQAADGWYEFTNYMPATPCDSGEITVTANPNGGGIVSGAGYYEGGSICTLTATANTDYSFVNWTKNGVVVSSSETYSFIVGGDAFYVGNFMKGVTIGSGTATNEYLPSYSYYNYTLSQQIYTAEEIGCDGIIKSVAFFNGGATKTRDYDVYMVSTEKTAFENTHDWIPVTGSDLVFSGQVTMNANEWTTLQFDTPFQYDGLSNIALVVDDNTGSWTYDPHMACRVFETQGNQAIRVYEDSPNYDPYNPSGYTGTLYSVKNQVKFGITPSTVEQTIALNEGWNWVSLYIDAEDPIELLQMLETALGENGLVIKSMDDYTTYEDGEWGAMGDLDEEGIVNEQMYAIQVSADCTVQLQGLLASPDAHAITIYPGWNWIGFPMDQVMSIEDALSDYNPEDGDVIKEMEDYSSYADGWGDTGDLEELTPGQGYKYFSNSTVPKTLVFSTGAKGKGVVFRGKRKE